MKKKDYSSDCKEKTSFKRPPKSLRFITLLFLVSMLSVTSIFGQSHTVSGVVVDRTNNDPLIGVSVAVKGATIGSITSLNGGFLLDLPSPNVTLVFSYIGYVTTEVPVNGQSKLTVLQIGRAHV